VIDVPLWEEGDLEAASAESVALDEAAAHLDASAPARELPLFEVTVYGSPAPQGSKTAKRNRHTGRIHLVESSARVRPWRGDVVEASTRALPRGWQPLTGALAAEMVFTLTRPPSHFGTGRNSGIVRPSARPLPIGAPDLSKLARSTEDALTTAGVYRDDALVVEYRRLEKRYHTDHGRRADVMAVAGCVIRLWRVEHERADT